MSFGKRTPSGELIDPRELYDEPEINREIFRVNSKDNPKVKGAIRPFFSRHPKLQRGIAIGLTGLTLGTGILFGAGGCGKPNKKVSTPNQHVSSEPANHTTRMTNKNESTNQNMKNVVVSEPIAVAEPGEISPREINAIRNDIGGLAKIDSRGWIYPNNVDGSPGHYKYDFSNPEQTILAYVEAVYNKDAGLAHIVLGDPIGDAKRIYWYLFKAVEENGENNPKIINDFKFMQYVYDIISGEKNAYLTDNQKKQLSEIIDEYNTEKTSLAITRENITSYRIINVNSERLKPSIERDETLLTEYRKSQKRLGLPDIEDVRIARLEINNTPSEYIDLTLVKINGKYVVSIVTFFD